MAPRRAVGMFSLTGLPKIASLPAEVVPVAGLPYPGTSSVATTPLPWAARYDFSFEGFYFLFFCCHVFFFFGDFEEFDFLLSSFFPGDFE